MQFGVLDRKLVSLIQVLIYMLKIILRRLHYDVGYFFYY